MEIRVHPILIEFGDLWRVLCENARDLVSKGITWELFAPACEEAANAKYVKLMQYECYITADGGHLIITL